MQWKAKPQDQGKKLIHFLAEMLGDEVSKRKIKQWLEQGQCRLNGRAERFSSKVLIIDDKISLSIPDESAAHLKKDPALVIFEDESLLAYNKPAGITSEELQKQLGIKLVHRLDKETSGLLLFGKNAHAVYQMECAFMKREVEKVYLALVDGVPKEQFGIIQKPLRRFGKLCAIHPQGKASETHWEKVRDDGVHSFILCRPKTGRTHQIRVHLQSLGHPILGDNTYCRLWRSNMRPQRHLLHVYQLSFIHPQTEETIQLRAAPPQDLESACFQIFGKTCAQLLGQGDG